MAQKLRMKQGAKAKLEELFLGVSWLRYFRGMEGGESRLDLDTRTTFEWYATKIGFFFQFFAVDFWVGFCWLYVWMRNGLFVLILSYVDDYGRVYRVIYDMTRRVISCFYCMRGFLGT